MIATKKVSVQRKIILAFVLFTLIAIAILNLCQGIFLGNIHNMVCINALEKSAEKIAENANSKELRKVADEISQKYSCKIYLFDNTTQSVLDLTKKEIAGCVLDDFSINLLTDIANDAKEQGGSTIYSFVYDSKEEAYRSNKFTAMSPSSNHSVVYTKYVDADKDNPYTVFINMMVTPVNTTLEASRYMMFAISGIMVIGAVILAIYISKTIAKPIVRVNKAAASLGNSNFSADFLACAEHSSYKEIDELAATLHSAQIELSKTDALRKELIANVSHDLRTPLTLISGYSEMMRDFPGEINGENLQMIVDECARLTTLVEDMMEISKLESGNIPINKENFDVTAEIESAIASYSNMLSYNGYNINFPHSENLCVYADPKMTMQAFYNLLNNALTYTGADRSVTIRQSVSNGSVRIEVTDTGAGIPKENLPLIFDRYYKIPSEHKRAARGTGLGLSIVRNVIVAMDGRYGVRSAVGYGSTFWFELPAKPVE